MRYKITLPIEISLNAESEDDAIMELLKIKSEMRNVYYLSTGTAILNIDIDKAKIKKLPF